jgi:stalled ribosome rescue protein Dom34
LRQHKVRSAARPDHLRNDPADAPGRATRRRTMTLFHAVIHIDPHQAQLLQFDAEQVQSSKLKAHSHPTHQHGSAVRTGHEFYAEVCDALAGITEVLVTGSHTAQADFRHYVDKHRPAVATQIAGYETVDHPSDKQLVALARAYFVKFDRMNGTPVPT